MKKFEASKEGSKGEKKRPYIFWRLFRASRFEGSGDTKPKPLIFLSIMLAMVMGRTRCRGRIKKEKYIQFD